MLSSFDLMMRFLRFFTVFTHVCQWNLRWLAMGASLCFMFEHSSSSFQAASICNSSRCAHARHVSLICSLFYACVFAPSTQEFMPVNLPPHPSVEKGLTRGYFTTLDKIKLLYNPHFPVVEGGKDDSQTYIVAVVFFCRDDLENAAACLTPLGSACWEMLRNWVG